MTEKELEQNIAASFYFGMAFGFASRYDEKDEILKNIREMIDEKDKKNIDAIEIAKMCERSTKAVEDYAIKSSLEEGKELCEDCISRQAVIDAFWKLDIELRPNAIDAILNMINNIPPVNPIKTVTNAKEAEEYQIKSSEEV